MGDESDSAELRQYAADVFGQAFADNAILREERQSINELLGTAIIQTHIAPQPNLAERVDPARYPDAESYLKAQRELFFGADRGRFPGRGLAHRAGAEGTSRSCKVSLLVGGVWEEQGSARTDAVDTSTTQQLGPIGRGR